jgi:hypothetical protein
MRDEQTPGPLLPLRLFVRRHPREADIALFAVVAIGTVIALAMNHVQVATFGVLCLVLYTTYVIGAAYDIVILVLAVAVSVRLWAADGLRGPAIIFGAIAVLILMRPRSRRRWNARKNT